MSKLQKNADIAGTIHVDQWLTNYSVGYMQDSTNFIAAAASSLVPVTKESNKYAIYPRGYFFRDEVERRPLGGRPVQVNYKVEEGTYLAEEWAIEYAVDDRTRANADNQVPVDENATRLLTGKQMIRADRIWCQKFFTAGVWAQEEIGGTDFTPFNDASSDPIGVIDTQKDVIAQQTGMMPNVLIMGVNVKRALRSNPDIIDRIKYTQRGIADNAILAALFEVDRLIVARAIYNAAMERLPGLSTERSDDAADFNFIADPNAMLLAYIDPNPSLDSPTAIARFSWTGLIPGMTNDMGGVIERGRDDRAHSDWFQDRQAFDLRQISSELAVFFRAATIPVSN